jgi:hypothetical protein
LSQGDALLGGEALEDVFGDEVDAPVGEGDDAPGFRESPGSLFKCDDSLAPTVLFRPVESLDIGKVENIAAVRAGEHSGNEIRVRCEHARQQKDDT